MIYHITAKNEVEAELLAIRKFFANDRQVSMLTQMTTKGKVYKCFLVNSKVTVKLIG